MRERGGGAPVLAVDGLVRRFASGAEVGPITLALGAGERMALTGPNGSGKSTLLRCVVGTVEPSEGTVRVGGDPGGTLAAKRRVGVSLSQERSFDLRLTGHMNLLLYARFRERTEAGARSSAASVVEELELEQIASLRVNQCSTGMVQQLAVARALLGEPDLLLLDEPTRSLDDAALERLWGALERRSQTAVLMATHRPEDVARCDRQLDLAS